MPDSPKVEFDTEINTMIFKVKQRMHFLAQFMGLRGELSAGILCINSSHGLEGGIPYVMCSALSNVVKNFAQTLDNREEVSLMTDISRAFALAAGHDLDIKKYNFVSKHPRAKFAGSLGRTIWRRDGHRVDPPPSYEAYMKLIYPAFINKVRSGRLLILPASFGGTGEGHCVGVAIYNQHLIYTNTGYLSKEIKSGTYIYKLKRDSIDTAFIEAINRAASADVFDQLITSVIVQDESPIYICHKPQKVGNCASSNNKKQIFTLIAFMRACNNAPGQAIDRAPLLAAIERDSGINIDLYKKLTSFIRAESLESYFTHKRKLEAHLASQSMRECDLAKRCISPTQNYKEFEEILYGKLWSKLAKPTPRDSSQRLMELFTRAKGLELADDIIISILANVASQISNQCQTRNPKRDIKDLEVEAKIINDFKAKHASFRNQPNSAHTIEQYHNFVIELRSHFANRPLDNRFKNLLNRLVHFIGRLCGYKPALQTLFLSHELRRTKKLVDIVNYERAAFSKPQVNDPQSTNSLHDLKKVSVL